MTASLRIPREERKPAGSVILPIVLLVVFSIGGLSPAALASSEPVVSRWATALERGELTDFCEVAASEQDLASRRWRDVRDVVETTQDIQVEIRTISESTVGAQTEVRLELKGSGSSRTAAPVPVVLPSIWYLTLIEMQGSPRILSAQTEESRTVERLLKASAGTRAELLDAIGHSTAGLARSLRDRRLHLDEVPSIHDLAVLLRERARRERDLSAEGDAVIALAHAERAAGRYPEARALIEGWLRDVPPEHSELILRGYVAAAQTAGPEETLLFKRYLDEIRGCLEESSDVRVQVDALYVETSYEIDTFQLTEAFAAVKRFRDTAAARKWTYALAWAAYHEGQIFRTVHNDQAASDRFSESAQLASSAGRSDIQLWALLLKGRSEYRKDPTSPRLMPLLEASRDAAPEDDFDARAYLLASIAIMYVERGDLGAADATANELLSILPETEANDSRRDGWHAVARTRNAQKRYAEEADAAAESLRAGERWILWLSWSTKILLAHGLRMLGRNAEALANLRESIELIETRRALIPLSARDSIHYFTDKAANYRILADLLVQMGRPSEALRIVERARSGTLRDLQSSAQQSPQPNEHGRLREKTIQSAIVTLNRRVAAARTGLEKTEAREALQQKRLELERFQTELAVSQPEAALRHALPLAPLRPDSQVPAADTAIFEYAVSEDHTMLFVVTRTGSQAPRITTRRIEISQKDLAAAVDAFVTQLRSRDFNYHTAARRLFRLLIAPANGLVARQTQFCIVPDDVLWRLPFQVLEELPNEPLLIRRAISYAPSISVLESMLRSKRAAGRPRSVLAVGDPERPGKPAPADSAQEIRSIAKVYPDAQVLLGKRASESVFKRQAAGRDVLHFAVHGNLDSESPMYSSLQLSTQDRSEDGNLEAREVAQMHLDARVAVLSACELGGGRIYEGEGIIGMSWAFLVAGCPTTVVSQWQADSRATARLMVDFHRALAAGASPAFALRQAALALRRDPDYFHPFYWASFETVGATSSP